MKIKSKRVIRMVVCILLSTMVLACSFSVFAVDLADRINAYEYLWCYYIYEFLNSIGIEVTYKDIVGYTDGVQDTIIDWVINYIADLIEADSVPSNYSIAQWVAPWQADYDYWGNLQFNSTMLEDMQDFAEWLKDYLGLIDNDTLVVNPHYSVQGVALFEPGVYYRTNSDVWISVSAYLADNSTNTSFVGYYVWHRTDVDENNYRQEWNIVRLFNSSGNAVYRGTAINADGTTHSIYGGTGYPTQGGHYYYSEISTYYNFASDFVYPIGDYYEGTFQEFQAFNSTAQIIQEGDTKVVTTLIVLPSDSPDYTEGDGVTIIDGVPQYEQITFSGRIENLPAVIQPQKVENPEIDQFYDFIPSFIEEAGDSMNFFKQIIFRMPDEVLYCIYSVLAAGVIFGFLRILREH